MVCPQIKGVKCMNTQIFRKKSIDKVKSPEQLNDYIRVSNPSVWLVLTAIIVLLIGICIWGIMGNIETKVSAVGTCTDGGMTCYVGDSDIQKIKSDAIIAVEGRQYEIAAIGNTAQKASAVVSEQLLQLSDFSQDEWVYEITAKTDLPDGDYRAEIIVERISPIFFILN